MKKYEDRCLPLNYKAFNAITCSQECIHQLEVSNKNLYRI